MLVLILTVLATGVLGERLKSGGVKKAKCTSNADCTGGFECDLTWSKDIKGVKYGMCRDATCTNVHGDSYCNEYSLEDHCHFDMYRRTLGNDYDFASLMDGACQKGCDPHCSGSVPLVSTRGDRTKLGSQGQFCTHHVECEGTLLCDYTQNTVKIGGYTMGVCRKSDCTEVYGLAAVYNCDREKEDPQVCGPRFNSRWEDCRVTCDPMCYGAPINTEFREDLDLVGLGVDRSLVAMHTAEPAQSTSVILQAFALFGFIVTAYGAGKFYTSK